MAAIASAIVGFGLLLVAWVLPLIAHDLPTWVQYGLLALGIFLIGLGIFLGRTKFKGESSISVKMKNGNSIGQIGNVYERGKEIR